MKYLEKITAFILCITLMCGLSGCLYKEKTEAKTFQTVVEGKGYTVLDMTDRFDPEVGVSACLSVYDAAQPFEITYYDVQTQKQAKAMCDQNMKKFEAFAGGEKGLKTGAGNNVKYELTADGRYMVNSSIGNTFIYADVPAEKAEEIKGILTELGY